MEENKKNLLVFINPVSGTGKSAIIFNNTYDFLKDNYNIKVQETLYPNYIDDYFKNNLDDIGNYDLIVGVGGDVLMYQIINNLKKTDYSPLPALAEIPTGSGNGYFKSITNEKGMKCDLESAIKIINDYNLIESDLLYIDNLDKYCRLAISWGFISDLDINTEWLRKLGSTRFILGAIWNLLMKNMYIGELEYLDNSDKKINVRGKFAYFWACNVSHGSVDVLSAPGAKHNDGKIYISYILDDNLTRFELLNIMYALFNGQHINHPKVNYINTKSFKLYTQSGIITVDGEKIKSKHVSVTNMKSEYNILF